jgi:hypothetical protein
LALVIEHFEDAVCVEEFDSGVQKVLVDDVAQFPR